MSKKKKEEINQDEVNLNEEEVKKKKTSIGESLKKAVGKFTGIFNKKAKSDNEDDVPKKRDEDGEEEKKPRKPFPFKEVLLVLGLSAALSVLILFVMDMGGLRTSMRSGITDFLLGMEKEILTQKLEIEYEQRIEGEMAQLLVTERENLVLEYENLDLAKKELDKREKGIVNSENRVQTLIDDLESEMGTVLEQQALLEGKISEIQDLAKIYESMEPINAAKIMATMENETLMLGILGNMKEDAIAEILELMETDKAADIISKMGE